MDIQVRSTDFKVIEPLRELFRGDANCQIVRDSILQRGLADPYLILVDGQTAGYAGVWNKHFKNRVMEFYALPERRADMIPMFRALLAVSRATHMEAQTNLPLMTTLLNEFTTEISVENLLFEEGEATRLACPPGAGFQRRGDEEGLDGDWIVKLNGKLVAAGGILDHYNPPYGDLYMEVVPEARRQGIGSYLVQELRAVCHDLGKIPAARCDPDNTASRLTLQRGGLRLCGRLQAGEIAIN